jgi:two-component system capsular synthesis response regulator RcsB
MFQNALIAEDHQSANQWIQQTLKGLGTVAVKYAYSCDAALIQVRNALADGAPFDLLITDLSFDGNDQVSTGRELIEAARALQPGLIILVFSAEQQPAAVSSLFQQLGINGYVKKGRDDAEQLEQAIGQLAAGKKYIPAEFRQEVRTRNAHDFSDFDILVISQLANGTSQKAMPDALKKANMQPTSLSSIEKRLNHIREALGFTKNEQLVAYCKDHKII